MIVFPDTNFFLHFKDPTEIPWSEVTTDDHIRVLICSNTQVELDKKKFELRGRPKQRARKWTASVGDIISNDAPVVLREAGPRITLELYLDRPADWVPPAGLNTSAVGDDSFVADVLAFKAETGEECALLSADTGPLGKAKRHGVTAISAMRAGWELPEETDDRDKQIGHLKKALEEASKRDPVISAVTTVDGRPAKEVTIQAVVYPALTEERLDALCAELAAKYPIVTDIPKPPDYEPPSEQESGVVDLARVDAPFDWQPPTDEQMDRYRASYGSWISDARKLMVDVPASLQEKRFEAVLELAISNTGSEPADDLLVTIEAAGGVRLRNEKDKDDDEDEHTEEKPSVPKVFNAMAKALRPPPKPTEWKKVYRRSASPTRLSGGGVRLSDLASGGPLAKIVEDQDRFSRLTRGALGGYAGISDMYRGIGGIKDPVSSIRFETPYVPPIRLFKPPRRDPEVFYWKNRPNDEFSTRWTFECKLFRHHIPAEEWIIPLVVGLENLKGGAVTFYVHAGNLQKPTKFSVPVRLDLHTEDTEALVRMLLPEAMQQGS